MRKQPVSPLAKISQQHVLKTATTGLDPIVEWPNAERTLRDYTITVKLKLNSRDGHPCQLFRADKKPFMPTSGSEIV